MVGKKVAEETRREDILRAAYDVAARQGLDALTLRAVAARADVSHASVVALTSSATDCRDEPMGFERSVAPLDAPLC